MDVAWPHADSPIRMARATTPAGLPAGQAAPLLDLIEDGVFTASPAGRLTYANAPLLRWLGHSTTHAAQRAGSHWIGLSASDESLWAVLRNAPRPDHLDVWIHRDDGTHMPAYATVRVVRDASHAIIGFEGVITSSPVHHRLARRLSRVKARLARRMTRTLATRLEERQAMARWLHDDIGHALVILKMDVDQLVERAEKNPTSSPRARELGTIRQSAETALGMVHALCSELRNAPAGVIDLASLLEPLTLSLTRRWRLKGRVITVGGRVRIDGRRALLLSEICREAVTNVIRHAEATSLTVRVMRRGPYFSVSVRDNGRGFAREAIERQNSFGVLGMRERAQALGGVLEITREDEYTVVSVCAPLHVTGPAGTGVPS